MFGMTSYGYLFADELTNYLIDETCFKNSHCNTYIYITSMYHMDPSYLCYPMLITVYIGMHPSNWESNLWVHLERYSI